MEETPRRREDILAREAAQLAPWAMRSELSRGRAHPEAESPFRTPFQRDRDRIVHSTAFRRLEYKTQVFVNHEGDHYRTRLTHTLEVTQVARSTARALGLNEDLVESVALAHDLGHPPFGHSGEDALDELMEEDGGFNHNRQTLRVLDRLEKRYPGFDGLNLSWEIRESIAKHKSKRAFPVPEEFQPRWRPLLEAQLVDIADALAYSSHDVDDGLRSDFIAVEDLREVRLWREAEEEALATAGGADGKVRIARAVSRLIDRQVRDLIEATAERLRRHGIEGVEKVRAHEGDLVDFSAGMRERIGELEGFLLTRLYRHWRIQKMAEKAKRFVSDIFREYQRNPLQLPPAFQARMGDEGRDRVICDYIAGMTDRYCQDEYKRLFYPFERMLMAEPNEPPGEGPPAPAAGSARRPAAAGGDLDPGRPDPAAPAAAAAPPAPPRPSSGRPRRAEEIHDRLTIFVVRALFFLVAGGIGFSCSVNFQTDPYLSILAAIAAAVVVILGEVFFSKSPIRTISAIAFGLIMGLIMSTVFQPVIEIMVDSIAPKDFLAKDRTLLLAFLRIVSTTVFCYFGVTVLLQTKEDFKFIIPYVEFRKEVKGRSPLILDTSAVIDGRIQALLSTGILDQRIAVPKFIFDELQAVADSPDRSRRERGRRGMDILDQLCREHGAEVLERNLPPGTEVDAALLELAATAGGKIVTTDYNLQKRARLQGITVLNLNDLASALKPAVVPGEALRVKLLRAGEDPGQAVGFLPDGTMVVVENSSRRIGQEVAIEVTSAIQTSAGKMVFGRLQRPSPAGRDGPEERGGRPGDRRRER